MDKCRLFWVDLLESCWNLYTSTVELKPAELAENISVDPSKKIVLFSKISDIFIISSWKNKKQNQTHWKKNHWVEYSFLNFWGESS